MTKQRETNSVLLILAFAALYLVPGVFSEYVWDDSAIFPILSLPTPQCGNSSAFQYTYECIDWWTFHQGRLFPFNFLLHNGALFLFPSVLSFKSFLLVLNLMTLFSFYLCVRELASPGYALWSMALLIPLVQFQSNPVDPYFFNGTHLWLTLFLLLSVWATNRFLKTRKRRYLVESLVLFLSASLTYEIGIPLVLIFVVVIWNHRKGREALRICAPYAASFFVLLLLQLFLRAWVKRRGQLYTGIEVGLDPILVIRAFFAQLSSLFPLSYSLADGKLWGESLGGMAKAKSAGVAVLGLFLYRRLAKHYPVKAGSLSSPAKRSVLLVAFCLITIPSAVIALSSMHQHHLSLGRPYLFQGLSCCGLAMLTPMVISKLSPSHQWRWVAGLALWIGLGFEMNQRVIQRLVPDREFRETTQAALQRGILSDLMASPVPLFVSSPTFGWQMWGGSQFHQYHSGRCFPYGPFEEPFARDWGSAVPSGGQRALVEKLGRAQGATFLTLLGGKAKGKWSGELSTESVRVYVYFGRNGARKPTLLQDNKPLSFVSFSRTTTGADWSIWDAKISSPLPLRPSALSVAFQ